MDPLVQSTLDVLIYSALHRILLVQLNQSAIAKIHLYLEENQPASTRQTYQFTGTLSSFLIICFLIGKLNRYETSQISLRSQGKSTIFMQRLFWYSCVVTESNMCRYQFIFGLQSETTCDCRTDSLHGVSRK